MKLILNDIKYLSLEHINIYKNRIYYEINNIRFNGLFIRINKNMIQKNNKYIIQLDNSIETLNDFFKKSFLKNGEINMIEVIKNDKTDIIFNDNNQYLVLNFMSINENNYPKIHILPCNVF